MIRLKTTAGGLALLLALAPAAAPQAQQSFVEVVHLRDGSSFQGIVFEQTPGVELKLRTAEGQELAFAEQDVLRLERQPLSAGASPVVYRDVVMLQDGVIFKGLIVEQIPGQSVTLAADNGLRLLFQSQEIWKLGKEERLAEQAADATAPKETRQVTTLRLQLQLHITTSKRQQTEKKEKPGKREKPGSSEAGQELEDEVERLEQELEGLSAEQRDEDRQEAQAQEQELREVIAKIQAMVAAYEDAPAAGQAAGQEASPAEQVVESSERGQRDRLVQGVEEDLAAVDSLLTELEARSARLQQEQDRRFQELSAAVAEREEQLEAKERVRELLAGKSWRKRGGDKELRQLVAQLPASERRMLYESFKRRDQVKGAGLNLVPGLNLGSYAQRDTRPALLGNLLSIGGIVLLAFGWDEQMGTDEQGPFVYSVPNAVGYAGLGVLAGSYALSILEPFRFVSSRNRALARVLRVSESP